MLTSIGCFFLDQWLWNVTWGWYHIPINTLLLIFLFNIWIGMRLWRACLVSMLLNLISFGLYTGLVIGILVYAAGIEYVMPVDTEVLPFIIWRPALFLGIIYTLLQLLLTYYFRFWFKTGFMRLYMVIIMSNMLATFFSYKFVLLRFV